MGKVFFIFAAGYVLGRMNASGESADQAVTAGARSIYGLVSRFASGPGRQTNTAQQTARMRAAEQTIIYGTWGQA